MNETTKSLERALALNRQLQRDLLTRINQISSLKMEVITTTHNMRKQLYHQVSICVCEKCKDDDDNNSGIGKKRKMSQISTTPNKNNRPLKIAKGWELNESKRWTRRFFIDPNQSIPVCNQDTLKRRQWEGDLIDVRNYRYNPWSKEEIELLRSSVEKVRIKQQQELVKNRHGSETNQIVNDVDIDFDAVTDIIEKNLSEQKLAPQKIKKIQSHSYISRDISDGTLMLRLPRDYRNKFLYSVSDAINKSPFSKEESSKLLDVINQSNHQSLDVVARSLNNARTPFQCFQRLQKVISGNIGTLNQDEDELLLKFIAASGPQFVLGHHTTTFMSQRFFPHLSTRQILTRVNTSLVNPNHRNERWSDDEERLLVLGMKSYSNDDHAISKVAVSIISM